MTAAPTLPAEIVVTESPSGVRYRLPPHDLGIFRWMGLLLIAFGLAAIGMAIGFVSFVVKMAGPNHFLLIGLLCPMPVLLGFAAIGGTLMFFGLWILAGYCEIHLTPKKLRVQLRVGPFWWTRRRPRARVRQFTVVLPVPGGVQIGNATLQSAWPKLQAECVGTKPLLLASGYAPDLLRALAHDLSRQVVLPTEYFADVLPAEPIVVAEEIDDPAAVQERPRQPPESPATIETCSDGVTITLPPAGIRRGTHAFVRWWTFLWCLFLVPATIAIVIALATGNLKDDAGQPVNSIWTLLSLAPFWLVGVVSLMLVLHRGRRRAVLAVADDQLMILQIGIFGTRQEEWSRRDLRAVHAVVTKHQDGEGATTWTTQLVIEPTDAPATKLLGYRTKQELEWIATVLRQALRIPSTERLENH